MHPINYDKLLYWITERDNVRRQKELGLLKPWSNDRVFQTVYFCNVDREDDKVTKYIREIYSPWVRHSLFTHNIILSRFLNWPDTLDQIGYIEYWDPAYVKIVLNNIKKRGEKVWGNAYVVTTHGIKMDKIDYLCDRVMPSIQYNLQTHSWRYCTEAAVELQRIEGISTFMAGQVVADLKNTIDHPLADAPDWWEFALPGPGSIRGMDWVYGERVPSNVWLDRLLDVQTQLKKDGFNLCAQNVQNCLCEFDKYMRVSTGSGRSKRSYDGL